ncbi:MAG: SIMPL domain-containing protein, partial [Rikenellaceae bacterium]
MKKIILLCAIVCFGVVGANAQEKNFIDLNYIEVTGTAIIKATPDIAYIDIIINESDPATKAIGLDKAEKKMMAALSSLNIDVEKDLTIDDITSAFARRKDVTLSKNYSLKLKDTKLISAVYAKLEAVGISNVNVQKFDLSSKEELRLKSKANAIINAKAKADALVKAAGRKLGEVLYIIDYDRENEFVTRSFA